MFVARQASRSCPQALRAARQSTRYGVRFQSTAAPSSSAGGSSTSHFASGLAGGVVGAAAIYLAYSLTPTGRMASKINKATKEVTKKYSEAAKKLQETTPDADQAVEHIKQLCYSYVGWLPGGRAFVDTAFKDYYAVREKHKDEVNQIVNDAYKQFQDVAKAGLSLATVTKAYEVLADVTQKISALAGDAIGDILDNHPELKDKIGGNVDQLKQMADQYGPEAKQQVEETWAQAKEIMAGGLTAANADKLRKLVEDKIQQLKKLGDEAWNKGIEAAQPYLDKNPKIKQLIEENAGALKQGNIKALFDKAKSAVDSGDIGDFETYVKQTVDKAKEKGSNLGGNFGLEQIFGMVPQGKEILPKLQQLGDVAKSHAREGEQLLKETMDDLKKVLEEKSKKAQKIAEKAKEESK